MRRTAAASVNMALASMEEEEEFNHIRVCARRDSQRNGTNTLSRNAGLREKGGGIY